LYEDELELVLPLPDDHQLLTTLAALLTTALFAEIPLKSTDVPAASIFAPADWLEPIEFHEFFANV
jgi:hypothetical protein